MFDITNVFYYGCVTLEKLKYFVIFCLNGVFFYYWKIKENHNILKYIMVVLKVQYERIIFYFKNDVIS